MRSPAAQQHAPFMTFGRAAGELWHRNILTRETTKQLFVLQEQLLFGISSSDPKPMYTCLLFLCTVHRLFMFILQCCHAVYIVWMEYALLLLSSQVPIHPQQLKASRLDQSVVSATWVNHPLAAVASRAAAHCYQCQQAMPAVASLVVARQVPGSIRQLWTGCGDTTARSFREVRMLLQPVVAVAKPQVSHESILHAVSSCSGIGRCGTCASGCQQFPLMAI